MKISVSATVKGYKIVGFKSGKAFSHYDRSTLSVRVGSTWRNTRHGLYLGTTERFVTEYYRFAEEGEDFVDLLLEFDVNPTDVIGTMSTGDGEFRVRKAILRKVTELPQL